MQHNYQLAVRGQMPQNAMPAMPNGYQPTQSAPISSDNILVNAATPILSLMTQIRYIAEHPNVSVLRAQVIEEIKKLERHLSESRYPVRTIVAARYCLCAAIDEVVLGCQWGLQSIWAQEGLLSLFHKQTYGGKQFYVILEHMLRDVRSNIDFIELCYLLLSLGYEGKLHGDQGRLAREEIRRRVFYAIRHSRNKPERALSPHWQNPKAPKAVAQEKKRLKKRLIITAGALIVLGVFFNYLTYRAARPVINQLADIGQVSPITTFSQVISRDVVMRKTTDSGDF